MLASAFSFAHILPCCGCMLAPASGGLLKRRTLLLGKALPCLAVFLGAGELPRCLVFSCVCAGMVPVAPAVCAGLSAPVALVAHGVV